MARGISFGKHSGLVTIWFGRWAVSLGGIIDSFPGARMFGDRWEFGPLGCVTRIRDR